MAIDTVVEEIADNLEEISVATRRINTNSVSFFLGGVAVGFGIGFYFGHKWNKEKIKAEAFKLSEEEVAQIRDDYQRKILVATPKPEIADVVEELGYTSTPVDRVDYTRPVGDLIDDHLHERPLPAPVPGLVEPRPPTVVSNNLDWDYEKEVASRTADEPFVIHQDEFTSKVTGYEQKVYTYYARDDVLVDEEEKPLPHPDLVIGQNNLQFGHGTDDVDVVYVRNNALQLEMEICRTNKSYEVEVLGLNPQEVEDVDEPDGT